MVLFTLEELFARSLFFGLRLYDCPLVYKVLYFVVVAVVHKLVADDIEVAERYGDYNPGSECAYGSENVYGHDYNTGYRKCRED